jgi:TonB family protein
VALEQFKTQILLLHSERSTLDKLSSGFADRYTVHCATSGSEALNTLGQTVIDVMVTAQELPGMSGLDALREAKKRSPDTLGILLAGNDDAGIEALVGANEVFQIVRGGVTPDSLRSLIDDATRQARLIQLTESANDTTADVDTSAEHIVMETSENGSSIITDVTGQVPALDPEKFAASNVGSRSVDVLVLTKDDEFLTTVRESARGMHNIVAASTLAQADEAVAGQSVGVAVVDAAMVGDNVEKLTLHLRTKAPRLVSIIAGRRDDGEMLMDLINRGKVYRFLLKPVSPGRARLAIEASAKHHLEAPDAAFKTVGGAKSVPPKAAKPAPTVTKKPQPQPAPKPTPKPAAAPVASKPKPAPKPKPGTADSQPVPHIVVEPRPVPVDTTSFDTDRLGDAFSGDDSSFTETMTGIIRTVGEKISSATSRDDDIGMVESVASVQSTDSMIDVADSGGSMFMNPKILGIGAAALLVAGALGWWMFGGSEDPVPADPVTVARPSITEQDPIFDTPVPDRSGAGVQELLDEARLAADAGQIFNPPGSNAIELYVAAANADPDNAEVAVEIAGVVEQALSMAESSLLARNSADADAALQRVALADPSNSRLPFLNAQLAQMQLREYLDASRLAIRDGRFEDAAVALNGARALGIDDVAEINVVSDELNAALSEQRVDDVLAKANARLDAGDLTTPSNDNARYFYELALSNDPGNTAAAQGLIVVASKLVLQARTEIDAGRFDAAEAFLADARRLDPNSAEVASSSSALNAARDQSSQRAAAQQRAERQAAAQTFAIEATAADALTDDKTPIPANLVETGSSGVAADTTVGNGQTAVIQQQVAQQAPVQQQSSVQNSAPVAASSLNRVKYVAPKYPRSAQRRNLQGWVEVEFSVDIDGSVRNVAVINSEPGLTFVNSAVKAVEAWKFEPVIENGVAVEKRAAVRMMFAVE